MTDCPVLRNVVAHDLCIGCGTCSAVCPRQRLVMSMDDRGFYLVAEKENAEPCPDSCSICARVCPFADGNPNEDDIASRLFDPGLARVPALGHYESCYVGWSQRGTQREDGASGGIATWFLTELLRRGDADRVICVGPQLAPEPLFAYKVCESAKEVESASRSAYYPVEMSRVLTEMLRSDGRYAIVCLPCFAKAIRLAAAAMPRIRERLACVIGLVCGHSVSAYFAQYAAALADGRTEPPCGVIFRTKDPRFPATNHGALCKWDSSESTIFWSEGPDEAWANHWFTPNPCFYCDDTFAETADLALMDAWLPEYTDDYRGTSLVIARSALADTVLREGNKAQNVRLELCSPDDVQRSQASLVEFKREGLAHRLFVASEAGTHTPTKRVEAKCASSSESARKWEKHLEAAQLGISTWRERESLQDYQTRMQEYGWRRPAPDATKRKSFARRALGKLVRLLRK